MEPTVVRVFRCGECSARDLAEMDAAHALVRMPDGDWRCPHWHPPAPSS